MRGESLEQSYSGEFWRLPDRGKIIMSQGTGPDTNI
jgi:hypothetical protein